jgi:hypothetical protein
LAEQLSRHIRFEERTVFLALEKALPEKPLEVAGNCVPSMNRHGWKPVRPSQPWRHKEKKGKKVRIP